MAGEMSLEEKLRPPEAQWEALGREGAGLESRISPSRLAAGIGCTFRRMGSGGNLQSRAEIVAWVASHVLPHEADLRAWLRQRLRSSAAVDDVVQEAYCRIAALTSVTHIENGRAYLFRTASAIVIDQIRRARIVQIDSVAEMDLLDVVHDEPTPERIVAGWRDLARVKSLIEGLPDRCRRVFELRRIHGLSQREVAEQLGVTENVVEQQSARGLKLILKALTEGGAEDIVPSKLAKWNEQHGNRKRDR